MTTPQPTSRPPNSTRMSGLAQRWSDVPRWAIIAFIAAIVLAGYWIYTRYSSNSSGPGGQWSSHAVSFLVSQGYEKDTSQEAIDNYVNGQSLTPSQIVLVAASIGALGTPSSPASDNAVTTAQLSSAPPSGPQILGGGTSSVGAGGSASSLPGSPQASSSIPAIADSTTTGTSDPAYWYVPVGVAGWSTTFAGIAEQFGTLTPTELQSDNPGLQKTTYGRIPVGSTVKIPRSTS